MLKKKDLAKEFELVVQQEIKNYNDSLSLVFQKLEENRKEIKDTQNSFSQSLANLESRLVQQGIFHQKELDSQKVFLSQKAVEIGALTKKLSKIDERISFLERQHEYLKEENQKLAKAFSGLKEDLELFYKQLSVFRQGLEENQKQELERHTHTLLNSVKNVIDKEDPLPALREKFDKKVDEFKTETEGYKRDLLKIKREQFVNEKKFENIYTLLKRQKGAN